MEDTKKVWSREKIAELFATNDVFVYRSLVKLFEYQTRDEQLSEMTKWHNNVGVRPNDAYMLAQLVRFYQAKGFLTPKQVMYARKKFAKYIGQLTRIANGKQ